MSTDIDQLLENEWYIVRHSGEIPEIAYNSAIYFLTRAKDGPRLELSREQYGVLQEAALLRYTEIVLRDLQHSNMEKSIYRGVERSRVNFARFCNFCRRQQLDESSVRLQAAEALHLFLDTELQELRRTGRPSIINCSWGELENYCAELGVLFSAKYARLKPYCPQV